MQPPADGWPSPERREQNPDDHQQAVAQLRQLILEAENSGPPIPLTRAEWDRIWEQATEEFVGRTCIKLGASHAPLDG
jgi:hypothetical protein